MKKALDVTVPLDTTAFDVQYESLSAEAAAEAGAATAATADGIPLYQAGKRKAEESPPDIFDCEGDSPHLVIEI